MKWTWKAAIQRWIAVLPRFLADPAYYVLQRRLGALRRLDPWSRFEGAVKAVEMARRQGLEPAGMRVLEVGTGWRLNSPLAFFLMGAAEVVTADLNRFLKPELVAEDVRILHSDEERVRRLLGDLFDPGRWSRLGQEPQSLGIRYLAPQDASRFDFLPHSFDLHFSMNTMEHIPEPVFRGIFSEAGRVLKEEGLAVHCIDHSDHFSHSDRSISSANFLSYSQSQWDRLAANRFAYVNRLRAPQYRQLLKDLGFRILEDEPTVDGRVVELLEAGQLQLDPAFQAFSLEDVATRNSWFTLRFGGDS